MEEILVEKITEEIFKIKLNRPKKGNSLTSEMLVRLYKVFDELPSECKVVIVGGEGKNFCTGHNIEELITDAFGIKRHFELCERVMRRLWDASQIVIAEVRGYAVAGGCQLACACDLIVASETARFGIVGIKAINLYCFTPQVFLSRCIGTKRAFELGITGETIDAQKAYEWGLVNRVVSDDKLEEETLELAKKIAVYDKEMLSQGKKFFYLQLEMPVKHALSYAVDAISVMGSYEGAQDKIKQFIKK
jgi:enoyl-CoA hydratase/carnithine racemase